LYIRQFLSFNVSPEEKEANYNEIYGWKQFHAYAVIGTDK